MMLGKRIRELRIQKGISGEKLAKAIGVKQPMISAYERGIKAPTLNTLSKLAVALGVSIDYLMGETDDPTREQPQGTTAYDAPEYNAGKIIYVPVIERALSACCGGGFPDMSSVYANIEDCLPFPQDIVGSISTDPELKPRIYYTEGDSMKDAGITDGALVLVNPAETVYNGDAAVVEYGPDRDVAVKRVYWLNNGAVRITSADGTSWQRDFTQEDMKLGFFRIIGKVMFAGVKPKRG